MWNTTTQNWLRRTVYDRVDRHKVLATFALSTIWHGFYPGYYLTALTAALCVQGNKKLQRLIQPLSRSSLKMTFFCDVLRCLITKIIIFYIHFPFVLLELWVSVRVFARLYFFGHILTFVILFFNINMFGKEKM